MIVIHCSGLNHYDLKTFNELHSYVVSVSVYFELRVPHVVRSLFVWVMRRRRWFRRFVGELTVTSVMCHFTQFQPFVSSPMLLSFDIVTTDSVIDKITDSCTDIFCDDTSIAIFSIASLLEFRYRCSWHLVNKMLRRYKDDEGRDLSRSKYCTVMSVKSWVRNTYLLIFYFIG